MSRVARATLIVLTLALAGCDALRDRLPGRAGVAASVAGQDLSVVQLASWIASIKRVRPKAENFTALAALYVDYMVFAAELAKGHDLDDSLLVLEARWPTAAQLRWNRYHAQLAAARAPLSPAEVDSTYTAGGVRLLQHLLIRVPTDAAPAVVESRRARAEALRRQIGPHGATFASLARRYSEDPGSKAGGGYLAAGGREEFVPAFGTAAWQLQPGEVSAVVRSPFGFHVIRRPLLDEIRSPFTDGVARLVTAHLDSAYVEGLATRRNLQIQDGAPALARQAFADLGTARTDSRPLVTYTGGVFAVKDLVRWMFAITPDEVSFLPGATDEQLRRFLHVVAIRQLLIAEVDSAGVALQPAEWRMLRVQHDSSVQAVEGALGVSVSLLADSGVSVDARLRFAATRVTTYLGRVFAGEAAFVSVPPFLSSVLRTREPWFVSPRGVARATAAAEATALGPADSTLRLRLAPGPAPLPQDPTHDRSVP